MPSANIYFPASWTPEGVQEFMADLADIAAERGFVTVHQSAERGNIRELLESIVAGETLLVLMAPEQQCIALQVLDAALPTLGTIERDAVGVLASVLRESIARMEAPHD
jgi:hypothetical protein